MMMKSLGEQGAVCGIHPKKNGEMVDVDKKWLTMARLCFSTSLIMTVFTLISSVATIIKPDNTISRKVDTCSALTVPAFIANCFVIPLCIFSQYSKPCVEIQWKNGEEVKGVYHQEYENFRTIWICMLALSIGLFVVVLIFMCCIACGAVCIALCFKKKLEEAENDLKKEAEKPQEVGNRAEAYIEAQREPEPVEVPKEVN